MILLRRPACRRWWWRGELANSGFGEVGQKLGMLKRLGIVWDVSANSSTE